MHRNSQKRWYVDGGAYFLTTCTHRFYPYFQEDCLAALMVEHIHYCMKMKKCRLYAFKVNTDHVHLLVRPGWEHDYSNVMGSLKRCFARDANFIITQSGKRDDTGKGDESSGKGDDHDRRLCRENVYPETRMEGTQFSKRYGRTFEVPPLAPYIKGFADSWTFSQGVHPLPRFKWQKSFHFHYIEGRRDFYMHMRYIERQWQKHGLHENKWLYVDNTYS